MMNDLTRREALTRIMAVGGSVPFLSAMSVLGFSAHEATAKEPNFQDTPFNPNIGKGKKVAIIGAGLSGLTAAYELSQQGFTCQIFEADKRAKGRTFTVRPDGSPDSWYQEVDNKKDVAKDKKTKFAGRPAEYCNFDEVDGKGTLYFEAGAGRIPSHHRTVLNYCNKFNVKLESFIFASRANLVHSEKFNGGKPVALRRFKHNLRGYLAEMLRTVDQEKLDKSITTDEYRRLLDKLGAVFGELKEVPELGTDLLGRKSGVKSTPSSADSEATDVERKKYEYIGDGNGKPRAGFQGRGPGAGRQAGKAWKPFALADLLQAEDIWEGQLFNDMRYYWQTSLMQPVGGMDNIAAAFLRQSTPSGKSLGSLIKLHTQVISVKVKEKSNKVIIKHQRVDHLGNNVGKKAAVYEADFCISAIAPSLLAKVDNDFSKKFTNALKNGAIKYSACKVAWQAERFWESDKNQIYGGISWTSQDISQIWYPSTGFHNQRAILTGAYLRGTELVNLAPENTPDYNPEAIPAKPNKAKFFGDKNHQERIAKAVREGARLHPELDPKEVDENGRPYNAVKKAMSIAWQNMPFQDAGWYDCTGHDEYAEKKYEIKKPIQKAEGISDQELEAQNNQIAVDNGLARVKNAEIEKRDKKIQKSNDKKRKEYYHRMLAGQENLLFMAGDAMSYLPGWMEGAITAGQLATSKVVAQLTPALTGERK